MEILGIGPLELLLIFLIALIVLGPGDMAKTGKTIGRFLHNVVTSQWWSGLRNTSRELRQLPYTLMREASLEDIGEEYQELKSIGRRGGFSPKPLERPEYPAWTETSNGLDHSVNNSHIDNLNIQSQNSEQITPHD